MDSKIVAYHGDTSSARMSVVDYEMATLETVFYS